MKDLSVVCDTCRQAFSSREALMEHASAKHGDLVNDYDILLEASARLSDSWDDVKRMLSSRNAEWGDHVFSVASRRDGGKEKLEEAMRARDQLETVVRQWHPGASVHIFGSSVVMGFWDGISDIDFTVVSEAEHSRGEWNPNEKKAVRSIGELLRRCGFHSENVETIVGARVPIIKHTAAVAPFRAIECPTDSSVSRTVRFLFEPQVPLADRRLFEKGLHTAFGRDTIQQLWWDPSFRLVNVTLASGSAAMSALLHSPALAESSVVRTAPAHDEHRPELYQLDFDLSFRLFGIRNSLLLKGYLQETLFGRPGAIVLKDWSKSSGVNNSMSGFFTSYAINIMWIYFLLRREKVTFIDPQDIPTTISSTDKGIDYVPIKPDGIDAGRWEETQSEMGALLADFFAFYTHEFDWEKNVVSLNRPGITTKEMLGWTHSTGKVRYDMCIEDPYEENLNLGRHIGVVRARKVITEFRRALVSIVKDSPTDSCVLSTAGSTEEVLESPKAAVIKLTSIALQELDAVGWKGVPSNALKTVFEKAASAEFELLSKLWSWEKLLYRLGMKISGGQVFPRIPVKGSPQRRQLSESEAQLLNEVRNTSTMQSLQKEFNASVASAPIDTPEWLVWQPPQFHLSGARVSASAEPAVVKRCAPAFGTLPSRADALKKAVPTIARSLSRIV